MDSIWSLYNRTYPKSQRFVTGREPKTSAKKLCNYTIHTGTSIPLRLTSVASLFRINCISFAYEPYCCNCNSAISSLRIFLSYGCMQYHRSAINHELEDKRLHLIVAEPNAHTGVPPHILLRLVSDENRVPKTSNARREF